MDSRGRVSWKGIGNPYDKEELTRGSGVRREILGGVRRRSTSETDPTGGDDGRVLVSVLQPSLDGLASR